MMDSFCTTRQKSPLHFRRGPTYGVYPAHRPNPGRTYKLLGSVLSRFWHGLSFSQTRLRHCFSVVGCALALRVVLLGILNGRGDLLITKNRPYSQHAGVTFGSKANRSSHTFRIAGGVSAGLRTHHDPDSPGNVLALRDDRQAFRWQTAESDSAIEVVPSRRKHSSETAQTLGVINLGICDPLSLMATWRRVHAPGANNLEYPLSISGGGTSKRWNDLRRGACQQIDAVLRRYSALLGVMYTLVRS
jgi:hypothetical protein